MCQDFSVNSLVILVFSVPFCSFVYFVGATIYMDESLQKTQRKALFLVTNLQEELVYRHYFYLLQRSILIGVSVNREQYFVLLSYYHNKFVQNRDHSWQLQVSFFLHN